MTNQRSTSSHPLNRTILALVPQLARQGFVASFIGSTVGIFRHPGSSVSSPWTIWIQPLVSASGARRAEFGFTVQRGAEEAMRIPMHGVNVWLTEIFDAHDDGSAWTINPDELEANFEAYQADKFAEQFDNGELATLLDEADDAFDRHAYARREPLITGERGQERWTDKARADRDRRIGR